jgi:hypothetical protein
MQLGIEEIYMKTNLIIFDPSASGSILQRHLEDDIAEQSSGKWQVLVKRGIHTITKRTYQIVYIQPGIMTIAQRHASRSFGEPQQSFSLFPTFDC